LERIVMNAQLSPAIAIHLSAALAALTLGPLALALKKGQRGHRAAGYAWITCMLSAAVSAMFIRDFQLPNIAGYTPIHLLVPGTFVGIGIAVWAIVHRDIARHRRAMWITYLGGGVGAGLFALAPDRLLGQWLWQGVQGLA
jgi:uncharacterized membrane protein